MRLLSTLIQFLLLLSSTCAADSNQPIASPFFENLKLFAGGVRSSISKIFSTPEATTQYSSTPTQNMTQVDNSEVIILAKSQIESGNLQGSIPNLLQAIEMNNSDYVAFGLLGAVFASLGQYNHAELLLYSSVTLSNWTDMVSIANLAEILRMDGDPQLSSQVALRGLSIPGNQDRSGLVSRSLATSLQTQGKYEEAADWFLSSALKNPLDVDSWIRSSTILFPTPHQNLTRALNVLHDAHLALPTQPKIPYYLGLALHLQGQPHLALPLYEMSLNLEEEQQTTSPLSNSSTSSSAPSSPSTSIKLDVLSSLATALHSLSRFSEASDAYSLALSLSTPTTDTNSVSPSASSSSSSSYPVLAGNYIKLICQISPSSSLTPPPPPSLPNDSNPTTNPDQTQQLEHQHQQLMTHRKNREIAQNILNQAHASHPNHPSLIQAIEFCQKH